MVTAIEESDAKYLFDPTKLTLKAGEVTVKRHHMRPLPRTVAIMPDVVAALGPLDSESCAEVKHTKTTVVYLYGDDGRTSPERVQLVTARSMSLADEHKITDIKIHTLLTWASAWTTWRLCVDVTVNVRQ